MMKAELLQWYRDEIAGVAPIPLSIGLREEAERLLETEGVNFSQWAKLTTRFNE